MTQVTTLLTRAVFAYENPTYKGKIFNILANPGHERF